ncbi:S1/P1 nuclease [Rasiella rasia]|uniref:S1/P1 nuclease n=1 Tax=Rasiella rasia TaxID=2744027 RepID=A0A6G6GKT5_9FLAO|nr:S1/P1 nuclease [Rasiella rasia]QIE59023.1 S1/P1 nuclease [Rasiella rasia]
MKALIQITFLLFIGIQVTATEVDWGVTGHRVTGEIAEKHLSKKAKRAIDKLLNGQSLAFVSTYADEIRSDDRYQEFAPWHYVNFEFGGTYEASTKNDKGDIYMAINRCVAILKDDTSSQSDKVFYLKMLVHFIGDIHQPLHVGIADDKGGNDFQVRWFNEGTNLHAVWDTDMIEHYNMSYTELTASAKRLSPLQVEAIQNSSVKDWMYESRALCETIYKNTEAGEKLSYRYMYNNFTTVRDQLQKGGIRLAGVLNDIFG